MDKRVKLTPGETYDHTNGDRYLCRRIEFGVPVLERITDSWTLRAYGVRRNEEGKIHWDYSTGGGWRRWQSVLQQNAVS